MASLAEIRARLQQEGDRKGGFTTENAVFPHWNLEDNSMAVVRFLADKDPNNTFFWIERLMIKLPFQGIKGQSDSKPITIQVPCVEMWGKTCPILSEVRGWFKDKSLEEMGRKYWKKKSYLFQGFVVDSGSIKEDKVPENPIRRFIISPQIFNLIKEALMDPELIDSPTHEEKGLDFRIKKTSKGGYGDYTTSSWARNSRALGPVEKAAIEKHGLFNLRDFLPKEPSADELKLIAEMFEASVGGDLFDGERWAQFLPKHGNRAASSPVVETESVQVVATPKVTVKIDAPSEPKGETVEMVATKEVATPVIKPVATGSKAEDILRMIRERKAAGNQ